MKYMLINRVFLSVLFLMIVVFLRPPVSDAQGPTLTIDQAIQTYVQSYSPYEDARREYSLARSQYLKYNTLKSRTDARDATLKMLQLRDDIVINYLVVLQLKLNETPGMSDTDKSLLTDKINSYMDWFTEHKNKLSSADTPEDLANDSNDAKNKFQEIPVFVDQIRARMAYSTMSDINKRSIETFSALKSKADQIRNDTREGYTISSKKQQTIDKWISESDNRLVRYQQKMTDVQNQIVSLTTQFNANPLRGPDFNNVFITLKDASQYLDSALSFMLEVISEIKLTNK